MFEPPHGKLAMERFGVPWEVRATWDGLGGRSGSGGGRTRPAGQVYTELLLTGYRPQPEVSLLSPQIESLFPGRGLALITWWL